MRATTSVMIIALLAKVLGFVEKQALAAYFGIDARVDAYFVAFSATFLFFVLVRELVEPSFLPVFVQALRDGSEARAWRLFGFVALLVGTVTLAYACYVVWAAPSVVRRLAPGFGTEAAGHAARMVRIMAPATVLLGLSALTYITLNGYRRFALPAAGDLALKGLPLLVLVLAIAQGAGIAALAVGFVVGAAARLGIHVFGLRTEVRRIGWPGRESRADLGQFGALLLPLMVGASFSFVSELADNFFSSLIGEGGVSARTFAKKIRDLPIEVLPYTLSVILFPFFAGLAATGERARLARLFARSAHGLAIVFTPLALALVLLAEPVVALALERGAFDADARLLTAAPLRMYGIGMVVFAVETVLVNLFFALKDTVTPIAVGILGVVVNIGLCAAWVEPLGVAGVALALTASKTLKVVVLGVFLARKGPFVDGPVLAAAMLRLALAAGIAGWGLHAWRSASSLELASASSSAVAVHLVTGGAVVLGLFLVVLATIGARERELLRSAPTLLRALGR